MKIVGLGFWREVPAVQARDAILSRAQSRRAARAGAGRRQRAYGHESGLRRL